MSWAGIRYDDTPIDRGDGSALYAQNARFAVTGEMRRRRGMARASLAKQGYAITGIGVASPPTGPIVILGGSTTLNGYGMGEDIDGNWGDVQLRPPTAAFVKDTGSDATGEVVHTIGPGMPAGPILDSDLGTFNYNTGGINTNSYRITMVANVTFTGIDSTEPGETASLVTLAGAAAGAATWSFVDSSGPDEAITSFINGVMNTAESVAALPNTSNHQVTSVWDLDVGGSVYAVYAQAYVAIGNISGTLGGTITVTSEQLTGLGAPSYTITLTRADDYATGFDVYAKATGYPTEPGDGILVGSVAIGADEDEAILNWEAPASGTYYFAAVAKRGDQRSPLGQLGAL